MFGRATIIALSLALGSAPALAAPQADPVSVTVRVADLHLGSAEGQQRLETRIRSAARAVCRTGARGVAERMLQDQCVAGAIADARPRVAQAIAQAQGGTRLALLMVKSAR